MRTRTPRVLANRGALHARPGRRSARASGQADPVAGRFPRDLADRAGLDGTPKP